MKAFWKTVLVHALILATYALFVLNYSSLITGTDEHGMGQLSLFLLCAICHSFIGVFFSINSTCNRAKSDHQILNEL